MIVMKNINGTLYRVDVPESTFDGMVKVDHPATLSTLLELEEINFKFTYYVVIAETKRPVYYFESDEHAFLFKLTT
jgi:hypothetical protein